MKSSRLMTLRSGKAVKSIFYLPSEQNSEASDSDDSDSVPVSSEDSFRNADDSLQSSDMSIGGEEVVSGFETDDIIALAIGQLESVKRDKSPASEEGNKAKAPAYPKSVEDIDDKKSGKIHVKPIQRDLNTKSNISKNVKRNLMRVSSSFFTLGNSFRRVYKGLSSTVVRLILSMIILLTTISRRIRYHTFRKSTKPTGVLTRSKSLQMNRQTSNHRSATKRTVFSYVINIINVLAIIFLLWKFAYTFDALPDPRTVGLNNCNEIKFPPSSRVHAWHILPPNSANLSVTDVLHRGLPIVFYARNKGELNMQHRVDILKALASNNFHVLAPVTPLSDVKSVEVWSHLNNISRNAVIYSWFEHEDVDAVKRIASTVCTNGYSPMGIIMETKRMDQVKFHSMEIWSSTCKTINHFGTYDKRKFNFLKCPISVQTSEKGMHDDVNSCFRAVDTNNLVM